MSNLVTVKDLDKAVIALAESRNGLGRPFGESFSSIYGHISSDISAQQDLHLHAKTELTGKLKMGPFESYYDIDELKKLYNV